MSSRLHIGIVGAGAFAPNFVPLFMAHPYVEKVYVTDLDPKRAEAMQTRFGCEIMPSMESMLESECINAIALFIPRHLHGPVALQALKAGKDVYSAVPMGNSLEECQAIIDEVISSRRIYMMGETCYYYPCACWCRDQYKAGAFGKMVYIASQYYHDLSGFNYQRLGEGWQKVAGLPPMLYPTHSFSMALSVADAYVAKLSCVGYRDTEDDQVFGDGLNLWDNPFSCETVLAQLSNGASARVSEYRRIGVYKPSSFISGVYGTRGAYECSLDRHMYQRKLYDDREDLEVTDVSAQVNPIEMMKHKNDPDFIIRAAHDAWGTEYFSPCQPFDRLPAAFRDAPNGHMATHQLLVDDFCRAAYQRQQPPLNAWFAARVNIPGLIAHESALKGGILMDVPDLGDMPSSFEKLNYEERL